MRTLMIITCPTPQRAPTLDALHQQGVDFEVLYLHAAAHAHKWGTISLNHPHRVIESPYEAFRYTMGTVLRGDVGTVVAFGYREAGQVGALLAARLRRCRVVTRSDASVDALAEEAPWRRLSRRLAMQALLPASTVVWSVGSKNEQYWRQQRGLQRFVPIPYEVPRLPAGSSPQDRSSAPQELLRVLYVGRLVGSKRVEDVIAALRSAEFTEVNWAFNIVGDGPHRPILEAWAGGDPRIRFVGASPYDDLASHYRSADVLVLPSSHEAWGLTVNEALGFGVRVIASNAVGAAHDLLTDDNGSIVDVADVPGWSAALLRARDYPQQRGRVPPSSTVSLMAGSLADLSGSSAVGPRTQPPRHLLPRRSRTPQS